MSISCLTQIFIFGGFKKKDIQVFRVRTKMGTQETNLFINFCCTLNILDILIINYIFGFKQLFFFLKKNVVLSITIKNIFLKKNKKLGCSPVSWICFYSQPFLFWSQPNCFAFNRSMKNTFILLFYYISMVKSLSYPSYIYPRFKF